MIEADPLFAAPLTGKCILITRARSQASELRRAIEEQGGQALEFPVIEIVPITDYGPLDEAISSVGDFQWIVFTSRNGVNFFYDRLLEKGLTASHIKADIAAVGSRTADAVKARGKPPAVISGEFKAEGLVEELKDRLKPGDRVLFPKGDIARAVIPDSLMAMGMIVTQVEVYRTVMSSDGAAEIVQKLKMNEIDAITFTSSSTVRNFCRALSGHCCSKLISGVKIACIGPVTANTAAQLGLQVDVMAEEYTIDGLLQALIRLFKEEAR